MKVSLNKVGFYWANSCKSEYFIFFLMLDRKLVLKLRRSFFCSTGSFFLRIDLGGELGAAGNAITGTGSLYVVTVKVSPFFSFVRIPVIAGITGGSVNDSME